MGFSSSYLRERMALRPIGRARSEDRPSIRFHMKRKMYHGERLAKDADQITYSYLQAPIQVTRTGVAR